MSKTLLVIRREYRTHVCKPSFWILALLVPLLLASLYAVPLLLASRSPEHADVLVVDETGLFQEQFRSSRHIAYHGAGSLPFAQQQLRETDTLSAILYIPRTETMLPSQALLYYQSDLPPANVQADVDAQLQRILQARILLDIHGLTPDQYALLTSAHITLSTQDIQTGRDGFIKVKTVVALLLPLLLFLAVFLFGAQVMRGIAEEKSTRVVEIIVSSIKPFQFMMGKVVGIGLAGITQFALWVLLAGLAIGGLRLTHADLFTQALQNQHLTEIATKGSDASAQLSQAQLDQALYEAGNGADKSALELIEGLSSINFGLLALLFLFYFVVGYLLYAALFAAVGALTDGETDAHQFVLPVTLPLLLCLLLSPLLLREPSGGLSVWLSIIPFTSPAAMLLRIPFGVKLPQLLLSMLLLLTTFPLCTWAAAKVYHHGILRHGQKAPWKSLFQHHKKE